MHRNKSVDVHRFAMIPAADIPRSTFDAQHAHKTTFDAGYLVPIYVNEVLPGDTFKGKMTAFCRMSTLIYPIMDNLYLDTFFFFVPNRLVWSNWKRFMGEQANPADSISFVVPQVTGTISGYPVGSVFDYMGLPVQGTGVGSGAWTHNALPMRAYNLIWNEWFRDENLQNSAPVLLTDGPDAASNYTLRRRGKRHDYFTSVLPFLQKGTAITLPLGTSAPVVTSSSAQATGAHVAMQLLDVAGNLPAAGVLKVSGTGSFDHQGGAAATVAQLYPSNLMADLSAATAATINQIRQSFQIQKLLERDARGGTRYTELVRSHFGVVSPDARLQRPEYIGGGSTPIQIHQVHQTSESSGTALGTLAAYGTAISQHQFTGAFTEHGYIIGLASVRADLIWQQGLRKLWTRSTRYDFYFPVFANLGEQAVLNKEIYFQAAAADNNVFGYQERWAEYRYQASRVSGLFRSQVANTLDAWHLGINYTSLPTLNDTFIQDNPPVTRVQAGGFGNAQFLFDGFFDIKMARPMPMYSVPGLVDHF